MSKARNLSDFISDPAIDSTELGDGSVTTAKLHNQAVTPDKLHTNLDLSSKTVTLASDGISGNSVHGGVISDFASTGIDDNASSTAITIDSNGRVGVGTASPTDLLHLNSAYPSIGFNDTNVTNLYHYISGASNKDLYLSADVNGVADGSLVVDVQGQVVLTVKSDEINTNNNSIVISKGSGSVDTQAKIFHETGISQFGNIVCGMVPNSINNNNGCILLHKMNQGVGFQFSGDYITMSWTGNLKFNGHIISSYIDSSVYVSGSTARGTVTTNSASYIRIATVSYAGSDWLAIIKNGGGTGTAYLNAFINGNIDRDGNGGIREIPAGSFSIVTTHATY